MRDLTSIPIPQSLFALIVVFWPFLIFWGRVVKCVHHHEFVVAQKHFGIWHRHDLTEDLDAIGVSVYYISKDIERVIALQVDLLHDGIKAPLLPMDIGHDINYGVPPPSSQHKHLPHFRGKSYFKNHNSQIIILTDVSGDQFTFQYEIVC